MGTFLQDLKFAVRNLRRTPAFPLAAVVTLALGIGATTSIFSTVNAALLRPLPYPNPQDLFGIRTALTDGRVTTGLLSGGEIARLNAPGLSIFKAAGAQPNQITFLRNDGQPVTTTGWAVTEGFFELFGLPMTLGGFTDADYQRQGPPTIVISYRIWRDVYGSDPQIVGKPIRFAELATTIAGVAPKHFDTPHGTDFWAAIRAQPDDVGHSQEGYLRAKPGTNLERLHGEMASVMAGLAKDFPAADLNRVYVTKPLVETVVGDLSAILLIVFSATALLLVLACVNVTNLLLARGAARAREMAVRLTLGAGRGRIVRQLLTESVLLAGVGLLVGLGVAYGGVQLLMSLGAAKLPRLDSVPFDGAVFGFAVTATIVASLIVGFAPALRLAGTDVRTLMNETGRSGGSGRATARWLNVMTVAQIALAITLVAGAGWLIRGFANLRALDPGFLSRGRLIWDATFLGPGFPNPPSVMEGRRRLEDELRAIPGVTAVASTSAFPLRGTQESSLLVSISGIPFDPNSPFGSRQRWVSPGFFEAMGGRILMGRGFDATDRAGGKPVAIVSETFVKRYLNGRNPIGVHFTSGYPDVDPRSDVEIVGVAADIRQKSLDEPAEPAFYLPIDQVPIRRVTMVMNTQATDPKALAALAASIRQRLQPAHPQVAIDILSAEELVGDTLRRQRLGMTLMLLFGATAVLLAAVGIYGVIAYAASQRRNEMATRLALGASPSDVFWLVVRQGRTLGLIGGAIGLTAAFLSGRTIASKLYGVSSTDPLILGGAVALVAAIVFLATALPAFRVSRTDPAGVLRPE